MDDKKIFQREVVIEKKKNLLSIKKTQQWGKGETTSLPRHKVSRRWLFKTWC
jgi:hypothetical protein